ncbi:hypothetical protein [Sphingomonas alpina]|uniref:Uncharacterized protein n=1 Tax=Sphingomonas alpina TaxID=653931 RepID=A0A7H0LHT3_9SPHN|nr:hypothetical protein [Sphingomonas alpina]QNQ09236.1 hypothetical protein H3Z74_21620 [Sphingomonas alpina]
MTVRAACWRALSAPWRAVAALRDAEARKGAALVLMATGGMAMTAYAGFALWIVRGEAKFAFYLGETALAIVLIVLTGFAGLLVRRRLAGEFFGNKFEISDEVLTAAVAGAAAANAVKTANESEPA